MKKENFNFMNTPRGNSLTNLCQQAENTSSEILTTMHQPDFTFGEVKNTTPKPLPDVPEIEKRTQQLAADIMIANDGPIITDAITTTPCYLGEQRRENLIDAISNQKGVFTSLIYLNGPREKFSEQEYQNKLAQLREYAKKDTRIIIVGHLYDDKPHIGVVRADMIDAIKKSIDYTKATNPKIIGLDADTYKLDHDYIVSMSKKLDTTNGFLSGKLRRYDANEAKGDEWAFIAERLYVSFMTNKKNSHDEKRLSGGSYGVKLSDYNKAGGFWRYWNKPGGEDSQLGYDLRDKAGIQGISFNKKVYVDPRRGQDAVNQGKSFSAQGEDDFSPLPLFDKEKAGQDYKDLTEISRKLLNGEHLTFVEQQRFEESINKFEFYGVVKDGSMENGSSSGMGIFIKRWNSITNSHYKMFSIRNARTGKIEIRLTEK